MKQPPHTFKHMNPLSRNPGSTPEVDLVPLAWEDDLSEHLQLIALITYMHDNFTRKYLFSKICLSWKWWNQKKNEKDSLSNWFG